MRLKIEEHRKKNQWNREFFHNWQTWQNKKERKYIVSVVKWDITTDPGDVLRTILHMLIWQFRWKEPTVQNAQTTVTHLVCNR